MINVAEKDQAMMAKLVDEARSTRSDEAIALVLETAYCVGRSTGFAECREMALAATKRPSLSEGTDHG